MRSAQLKGRDRIVSLREKIVQLRVAVLGPQRTTTSSPQQSGSVRMVVEINKVPGTKATIKTIDRELITKGSNVFDVRVWDIEHESV